jgi:hypothetical protein
MTNKNRLVLGIFKSTVAWELPELLNVLLFTNDSSEMYQIRYQEMCESKTDLLLNLKFLVVYKIIN